MATAWPANIDGPMTGVAAINALNNLCGYPLGHADKLADFGPNREELRRLLRIAQAAEPTK
ncbi:MAG: hypothetical protein ABS36_18640 [Acidobacteria bacterium SCN 69-37]|nr:MAG: hypothetical protein ABS36_18640 [Acidobacteria bacterium SCN 69-37]